MQQECNAGPMATIWYNFNITSGLLYAREVCFPNNFQQLVHVLVIATTFVSLLTARSQMWPSPILIRRTLRRIANLILMPRILVRPHQVLIHRLFQNAVLLRRLIQHSAMEGLRNFRSCEDVDFSTLRIRKLILTQTLHTRIRDILISKGLPTASTIGPLEIAEIFRNDCSWSDCSA